MGKYFYQFCLILTAFLLFLFPEQCVAGAKNGLLLWSGTIVPTLLPFFLLTNLMMKYQTVHYISYLFYPLFKLFPWLNKDLAYTILMGFLCGYPLGGKIISDLVLSGSYTKKEGESLLVLCNNVSPMFSIGFTLTLILKGTLVYPFIFSVFICPISCTLSSSYGNSEAQDFYTCIRNTRGLRRSNPLTRLFLTV